MPNLVIIALVAVVFVTLLAWLGGRLLGIQQSWARGLLASVIGLSVGTALALALALAPQNPLPYPVFFLLIILLPSAPTSMAVSGPLELLARPGLLVRIESRLFEARRLSCGL